MLPMQHFHKTRRQHWLADRCQLRAEAYIENLTKDNSVITTDQGVVYKIIQAGADSYPKTDNEVQLTYVGKHLNGEIFDQGNEPVWLPLTGIFPGWREVLLLMPTGSHWMIVVPPHLAYGETGAGERIGPNETLIFELKLHAIR